MTTAFLDQEWHEFLKTVATHPDLVWDLHSYKRPQVERRLQGFLLREGYSSLPQLAAALASQPDLARRMKNFVTVHVSEFFRDRSYWDRLDAVVAQAPWGHQARVWSAGCSWGAEPATVWLMQRKAGRRCEIWATDTDRPVLEEAQTLTFPKETWTAQLEPYRPFVKIYPNGRWTLEESARQDIHFAVQDLLEAHAYPQQFDLVLCRHVLIYFSQEAKQQVLSTLVDSLKPGGYLFIGAAEMLLEARDMGLQAVSPSLFQKST
ncbi:MAG: protein-glutamate O-methyltransferase CheR [Sulfobacillus thermotolerans]|uniref:CheR-type methyltransferase domain-containing protein n=1 Tax=Sulfobacillus thermotolerans TaxID=338644 RepID=A0ABN5H2Z7_9FIRM|nr:hypothetical protein BXT84_13365 [Sulfobacillus thermotolerans]MCY0906816.1 protein-glutamate O-methyltransferase CheR [Sulfobacillus thermotolerans]